MKPTYDSLVLRVSCLHTHQTLFLSPSLYKRNAVVICIITMDVRKLSKGVAPE